MTDGATETARASVGTRGIVRAKKSSVLANFLAKTKLRPWKSAASSFRFCLLFFISPHYPPKTLISQRKIKKCGENSMAQQSRKIQYTKKNKQTMYKNAEDNTKIQQIYIVICGLFFVVLKLFFNIRNFALYVFLGPC